MNKNKTVIGEINVEVKAGLSVDRKTANICIDLLSIYFKNNGAKGIVIAFSEDNIYNPNTQTLMTDNAVEEAIAAAFRSR